MGDVVYRPGKQFRLTVAHELAHRSVRAEDAAASGLYFDLAHAADIEHGTERRFALAQQIGGLSRVRHCARTGASSRALGSQTAVSQPVNSDCAYASSDGCPSASINSNTPPGPARCHCNGGSSFPMNQSSCSDCAMI